MITVALPVASGAQATPTERPRSGAPVTPVRRLDDKTPHPSTRTEVILRAKEAEGGGNMLIEARKDALFVRLGRRFDLLEARRLQDATVAFGPCSQLVIDFMSVQESDDAGLSSLAEVLLAVPDGNFELRGITLHQARVLEYLRSAARRASPPAAALQGA
jgi:hypothetical protein